MHAALRLLSRTQLSRPARFGIVVLAVALVTLLRLVAPLDAAPFVLYMPLIFLATLALGWGAGLLSVVLSDLLGGFLFVNAASGDALTTAEIIGLVENLLVGSAMVAICDALRRAILDNETTLAHLQQSRAALEEAKAEADRSKEAAETANTAKSTFLANMSHELRTPLSAVIGYSEMLEEEIEELGETSMLTDLGKIKSNAKHLLSLINDVLDLSKIEANKMDLYVETLALRPFTEDVAATVGSLIARKGNTLDLDVDPDAGSMQTDVVKLRQCLFNLLSNAAKFTEQGRITLSVRRERTDAGDWISFAVRDTGIGMTPEQLERLFQRFSQADETTTRQFGGTGLGLALSRAFAQLLGGDIAVESAPGRGTCFTLRLPALPADAEAVADPAAPQPSRDLVLVIDDEAAQRELMRRFLERRGYAVQTAASGRAGLNLAMALKPRVILLDVMMPEMDGWSVLGALKANPETAAIPVVMVSFVADPGMSQALGAAEALAKPVDWSRLEQVVAQFRTGEAALVVDDDPDMRRRLRTVLERNGWTVQEAGNGAEALALVDPPPKLILLDLTMPVMDGFAFLHELRERPGCADITVVVLSARDISGAERAQLAGADRILKKGEASMQDLAKEVRQLQA